MKSEKSRFTTRDVVIMALLIALLVVSKEALAFLPNIELVSLLIILYSLQFGKKTIFIIIAFILIEGLLYGFGTWWWAYLYTWPLLYILTRVLRKFTNPLAFVILCGGFGLAFGFLCALVYLPISGPQTAIAWFLAGLPYDVIHCVGNTIIAAVLFVPLRKAFKRLNSGTPQKCADKNIKFFA